MIKAFISRSLSKDSILKTIKEIDFTGQSLLSFSSLPFTLPESEWLFFYSQNGVKYFLLQQANIKDKKIAAIGSKTAKLLIQKGYDVDFIGDGNPQSTANKFKTIKGKTTYIRANDSSNSIKKLINDKYDTDIAVYDNIMSDNVPQSKFDVIIFTSTKNAQAYFKARAFNNEKVIAIGCPTSNYLASIGIKSTIPPTPTEEGIYELLSTSFFL